MQLKYSEDLEISNRRCEYGTCETLRILDRVSYLLLLLSFISSLDSLNM